MGRRSVQQYEVAMRSANQQILDLKDKVKSLSDQNEKLKGAIESIDGENNTRGFKELVKVNENLRIRISELEKAQELLEIENEDLKKSVQSLMIEKSDSGDAQQMEEIRKRLKIIELALELPNASSIIKLTLSDIIKSTDGTDVTNKNEVTVSNQSSYDVMKVPINFESDYHSMTYAQLADKYKVSTSTIKRWVEKSGVTPKGRGSHLKKGYRVK